MIDIFLFFTVGAGMLITDMLLFLTYFVLFTALAAFLDLTTHTLAFVALFVRFKAVLSIEVAVTVRAIHFCGLEHCKIGTCLVFSVTGATVLPHTVVMRMCFFIVAFLAVIRVVTAVQQCRNTSQSVEMVFHFKQHNFLRSIIISTVFEPQQTLHGFKHLDLMCRTQELLNLLDLLQTTRSLRHTRLPVQLLGENFLRPATSSKFFIPWVLIR